VRGRIEAQQQKAIERLRELEATLEKLDERLRVLAHIAPGLAEPDATDTTPATQEENGQRDLLRGPAIRDVAVRVLRVQSPPLEALHYRRWYELVRAAGYEIAGKDPVAVFLTQLTRSPVIRKSTQSGVYALDPQAPVRLRTRLESLQAELREATVTPDAAADLPEIRARRQDLELAVNHCERALEEALRVLDSSVGRTDSAIASAG